VDRELGQGLADYAIALALIAICIVVAIVLLGDHVSVILSNSTHGV
jgi:Flp pilus assembly pilin Flp